MTTAAEIQHLKEHGLYSNANEHDACGVGFVLGTFVALQYSSLLLQFSGVRHDDGSRNPTPQRTRSVFQRQ